MILSSNISGQGRRQGRGGSSGSSNLIKWVRGGLIILGACNAIFGKATRTERSPEDEREMLKKEALHLKKRLAVIENRIAELEGNPAFVVDGTGEEMKNTVSDKNINGKLTKAIL